MKREVVDDFKIQRVKARATVFFHDGEALEGSFFVSPVSELHSGRQSIAELLEEDRSYLPFESKAGGLLLLSAGAIERVALEKAGRATGLGLPSDISSEKKARVRVTLLSSRTLEGTIPFDMPPSHARVSDFLNSRRKFFTMIVKGRPNLINHRLVRSILLL